MPDRAYRQTVVRNARHVVVKVGTHSICAQGGRPDRRAIGRLARQIAALRQRGVVVTLVASGAIGAGMGELGLSARPRTLPQLQATAAVGQGELMRTFHDVFARHGVTVAQVLVTREDFDSRPRYLNIRNTLSALGDFGAMAIVNENDTVAVDEIRFGENDVLAALVTTMLGADLLVLLTNVDGVIKDGEVLDVIEQVDEGTLDLARPTRSSLGSGGMSSKLVAAGLVTRAGEVAIIANARAPSVLRRIVEGKRVGTLFVPAGRRMSGRRRWIAQASRPAGRIVVDDGAVRALREKGKSLLASGIVDVIGRFDAGATVIVVDGRDREVARGLTNYASEQIDRIKGLKSSRIADVLGEKPYDEVVHRDNLSLP